MNDRYPRLSPFPKSPLERGVSMTALEQASSKHERIRPAKFPYRETE